MTSKRQTEQRIRTLRDRLDAALAKQDHKLADVILEELEVLDPEEQRWPHKRGDVLRRLGRKDDAILCYERAAVLYQQVGFLPRAIAMAKVILELAPERVDVLERIDPTAARALHRQVRPEGVHIDELGGASRRVDDEAIELGEGDEDYADEDYADEDYGDEGYADEGEDGDEGAYAHGDPEQDEYEGGDDDSQGAEDDDLRAGVDRRREASRTTLELDISEIELADAEEEQAEGDELAQPAPAVVPRRRYTAAERQACLPLLPLFAEAPKEALMELVRASELVTLPHGALVVRRGDPADALYGIVDGSVRVRVPGLAEHAWPRLAAGDVFGEACLLSSEPRRADVVADGELIALRIPKQTLSYLVRVHESLANVLFEMMTRRLIANLLNTSGLFAELSPTERREVARELELRRARAGTDLLVPGRHADALYITLTGHIEVLDEASSPEPQLAGAGVMFGHASLLEPRPSGIGVRAYDTLLALRLPRESFTRVAMDYPAIVLRLCELPELAKVGS